MFKTKGSDRESRRIRKLGKIMRIFWLEFIIKKSFENFHEPPETVFRHNIKHIKVRGQMNFVQLQMPFQVIFRKTLLLIKIIGSALG